MRREHIGTLVRPFNIVHEARQAGEAFDVTVMWDRNLGFSDSFEEYDDFATGEFGGWTTLNLNTQTSCPIAMGQATNIVSFPGCSTPEQPASVPPMVFNPNATTPSMEMDASVAAPDGAKTVLFQGAGNAKADKWLISPRPAIRDGYRLSFLAKAYTFYPESLEHRGVS